MSLSFLDAGETHSDHFHSPAVRQSERARDQADHGSSGTDGLHD